MTRRQKRQHRAAIATAAYITVARPILAAIQPRNSCISQSRVHVECMKRIGIPARPICTSLIVQAPSLQLAYISGFTDEEKTKLRGQCSSWQDAYDDEPGWRGHVCALVDNSWFLDSSLDQASTPSRGMILEPDILVMRIGPYNDGKTVIDAKVTTSLGLDLEIKYIPKVDSSFLTLDAWANLDYLNDMCDYIVVGMKDLIAQHEML